MLTAPFNLPVSPRTAYYDRFTVNGEEYSLEQLLNYLSENLGGEGTDDITEASGNPNGDPGSGPEVYQNTDNGQLWIWNGTTWILLGPGLPEYNSPQDATDNGIVSGQRWKYAANNWDGMPPGLVVEQL
ncbi:MAG: hypothetical protein AAGJ93_07075 [Bacteroidota bacterium]